MKRTPLKRVTVYSDGGCQPNPGVGAWAAILEFKGHRKELVGGDDNTTNNRMELLAAIHALEALKEPCAVALHTDSEYLQKGVTEWMPKWKALGWRRGKKSSSHNVKNLDLWQRLDQALQRHKTTFHWVRGHAGHPVNERCDELCWKEIERRYKEKLKATGTEEE